MSRSYCFTWNNYKQEDIDSLMKYEHRYIVIGLEKAPETGTPHLQGYIEFTSPKRLTTLHKAYPKVHWEPRKGTAAQASEYCKKGEEYVEDGQISKQGQRTDLETVARMALDKTIPIEDITEQYPKQALLYTRRITELRHASYTNRTKQPEITWLWGKTGVGKTRYAFDHHTDVYIKDGTQWWNEYTQNEAIVIDDFDGKWPIRDLLRLLDRYPYQGQTKGSYVKINSPYIYITCEHPPQHFWSDDILAQILRRINESGGKIEHIQINMKQDSETEVEGNTSASTSDETTTTTTTTE